MASISCPLFLKRIKLKSILSKKVFFTQRNNQYTISEGILALIYPIALGFGKIETTHLLRHNGVFQYLTGLPAYPDPQTLRRFLLRMAPLALPRLRRLHDKLLSAMMLKPSPPTRIIFDMDSTVLVLYGKQELANIGYNPKKRGRPSYHPLVCFNGITSGRLFCPSHGASPAHGSRRLRILFSFGFTRSADRSA